MSTHLRVGALLAENSITKALAYIRGTMVEVQSGGIETIA